MTDEKGFYPVSAIATILDLDTRRVQQLAKEGIIPKGRRGRYHLIEAVRGYVRFLRTAGAEVPAAGELGREQLRRMRADADLKELELKERRGDLRPAEAFDEAIERVIGGFTAVANGRLSRFEREMVKCTTAGDARKLTQRMSAALMTGAREYANEWELEADALEKAAAV